MRILLLEPYCGGSHRAWAEGYAAHSRHDVTLLVLPARFWKWRMQGGAVTLAEQARALTSRPDLILASDMLNLSAFLGLARDFLSGVRTALYFHENQLTYPLPPSSPLPGRKEGGLYVLAEEALENEGPDFRVVLAGKNYRQTAPEFEVARERRPACTRTLRACWRGCAGRWPIPTGPARWRQNSVPLPPASTGWRWGRATMRCWRQEQNVKHEGNIPS